jgi:predicted acyl esterase
LKVVTRFRHQYTETEDCWIPMPDGVRLAAKLLLPDIAAKKRVPIGRGNPGDPRGCGAE